MLSFFKEDIVLALICDVVLSIIIMGCVCEKFGCGRNSSSNEESGKEIKVQNGRGLGRHKLRDVMIEDNVWYVNIPSQNIRLEFAFITRHGHYPDSPDRENQDCLCIKTQLQGNPDLHFFGVFDGHGQFGAQCSNFVKERLVEMLSTDSKLLEDPIKAYNSSFLAINAELHETEIDDSMSGTTAITVLFCRDKLFVANVGDSRAVAGVWDGGYVKAQDLSTDQTPFRKDEYERVKRCGARVLNVDQVEGIMDPNVQNWGNEEDNDGDPPRLWIQDEMYPGTAFTRSVGDSTAESIGVIAEPETLTVKITPDHRFLVIASDGVFEFLSSQAVVNMVANYNDPHDACSAVTAEAYKLWLEHDSRTDDITIIVIHIKDGCNSGWATSNIMAANTKQSLSVAGRAIPERCIIFPESAIHNSGPGDFATDSP